MELQLEGLKKLISHSKNNTKYYKNIPNIKSLEDLNKIPVLTKYKIKKNFQKLLAKNVPGFIVKTGGTISKSTTIKDMRLKLNFGEKRFKSWYKKSLKKFCSIKGSLYTGKKPKQIGKTLYLPVESLKSRKDAINYLKLISDFRPDWIQSYSSAIRFLAHYALQEGIRPQVGVIQSTSETLLPEARKEIEEAFQCELFNFYGSIELGSMAQDCQIHNELHINAERYIVEELDGRLLFTDLLNYVMPLIRYENQDTGELSDKKCICGRGLPTLKKVIGRAMDFILTKKGTWVQARSGGIIKKDVFDWVEAFQFKQEEKGEITVFLKPWSDVKKIPKLEPLKDLLHEYYPPDELDISIEVVDSLVLSPTGKQIRLVTNFQPWDA
ncbi:MAG: hypothetical protein ACFFDT_33360 [Candidatus Hodarchaeota archaeon]